MLSFGRDYADKLGSCGSEQATIRAYTYAIGALVSLPIDGKRLLGERYQMKSEKMVAWRPVEKTKKMKAFFFFFFLEFSKILFFVFFGHFLLQLF